MTLIFSLMHYNGTSLPACDVNHIRCGFDNSSGSHYHSEGQVVKMHRIIRISQEGGDGVVRFRVDDTTKLIKVLQGCKCFTFIHTYMFV